MHYGTAMQHPPAEISNLWDRPEPFAVPVLVKPEHIDALGHTNNVHYVEWLQECAWRHSAAVGFPTDRMLATGCAMAVHESRMSYLAATFAGDELWVGDWIVRNDGRLRATRAFQILRVQDGTCVMRAEIDYICIKVATGRPSRMPQDFVSAYAVLPAEAVLPEQAVVDKP